MLNLWLVKLGKMYYAGGLTRKPNNDGSFSYEFARDEEVAFLFSYEDIAKRVADKCGGTVIMKELTSEEYTRLLDKKDRYDDSENEVIEEQKAAIMKDMINHPSSL